MFCVHALPHVSLVLLCEHLRWEETKAGTVCLHTVTGKHSITAGAVPVAVLSWKADGGSDQEIHAVLPFAYLAAYLLTASMPLAACKSTVFLFQIGHRKNTICLLAAFKRNGSLHFFLQSKQLS